MPDDGGIGGILITRPIDPGLPPSAAVIKRAMVGRFFGLDQERDGDAVKTILDNIWEALRDAEIMQQVHAAEFQLSYERLVVTTGKSTETCARVVAGLVCTLCGTVAPHLIVRGRPNPVHRRN